ncbi:unnamed protein product [Closterium sp. NIES-53]
MRGSGGTAWPIAFFRAWRRCSVAESPTAGWRNSIAPPRHRCVAARNGDRTAAAKPAYDALTLSTQSDQLTCLTRFTQLTQLTQWTQSSTKSSLPHHIKSLRLLSPVSPTLGGEFPPLPRGRYDAQAAIFPPIAPQVFSPRGLASGGRFVAAKVSQRVGTAAAEAAGGRGGGRRWGGGNPGGWRKRGPEKAAEHGDAGGRRGASARKKGNSMGRGKGEVCPGAPKTESEQGALGRERGGSGRGRSEEGAEMLPPSAGREMERLRDNLARMRREALGRALERAGREGHVGWAEAQWLVEGMMKKGDGIRAYRVSEAMVGMGL